MISFWVAVLMAGSAFVIGVVIGALAMDAAGRAQGAAHDALKSTLPPDRRELP